MCSSPMHILSFRAWRWIRQAVIAWKIASRLSIDSRFDGSLLKSPDLESHLTGKDLHSAGVAPNVVICFSITELSVWSSMMKDSQRGRFEKAVTSNAKLSR